MKKRAKGKARGKQKVSETAMKLLKVKYVVKLVLKHSLLWMAGALGAIGIDSYLQGLFEYNDNLSLLVSVGLGAYILYTISYLAEIDYARYKQMFPDQETLDKLQSAASKMGFVHHGDDSDSEEESDGEEEVQDGEEDEVEEKEQESRIGF